MAWITITEHLNAMGKTFLDYTVAIQIESAVLVGFALVVEFALRKAVRPSVRYWLVTCLLTSILLSPLYSLCPPSNCLPTGSAAYADPTTHTRVLPEDSMAAEGISQSPSTAAANPGYTRAPLCRPTTGQSQTTVAGMEGGDRVPGTRLYGVLGARPQSRSGLTWPGAILVAWLVGVVAAAAVLIRRGLAAHRCVAGSYRATPLMTELLSYCRQRMAVASPVRLKVAPVGTPPVLCSLWRPTILVPSDLAPTLGSGHLRTLLLHQLAHVKRYDMWVNMVQNIVTIPYFYNPFVWIANRVIRRLRDQAADETVLDSVSGEHRWYRRRLADVADLTNRPVPCLEPVSVS
jgi:beta-lactamase regulating signal transducer with metallopeptidase domain